MAKVGQTDVFATWFEGLKDRAAGARITARNAAGQGVSEMRIDYGPGYRVYFVQRGDALVILLCGGEKRDQSRDIARALELGQRGLTDGA